ncbi:MAG: CRISPR-associated endonuclease Cas2 [Proteobacteria bacterium]|jgi:CRISPR-associated protein Cas2|nr:CRISPR-associated endonuclease Cas2 [Pseudomonadota bacterium]MBU1714417.1 CRISPR-associated endonuclease Cas2 [Pseudomonadota bacterium]
MLTWVIYDIVKNKSRTKVAKFCKEYGLYRVQKSCFLGDLNKNEVDELGLKCKDLINLETDAVYLFPVCEDDFRKIRLLGNSFDTLLVSGKLQALIL